MVQSRKEAETVLLTKAAQDPGFRKQLIDSPKDVITRELGLVLPPDVKVHVLEESAKELYLVLPPRPPSKGELADADLDQVAGGMAVASAKDHAPQAAPAITTAGLRQGL